MKENVVKVNAENVDEIIAKLEAVDDLVPHAEQVLKLIFYLNKSNKDLAFKWINIGIELGEKTKENTYLGAIYIQLGNYYFFFHPLEKAIVSYNKALTYYGETDYKGLSAIYTSLGSIARNQLKEEEGYKLLAKALNFAKKEGVPKHINRIKTVLASCANAVGRHEHALALTYEVLDETDETQEEDVMTIAYAYHGLSETYGNLKEHKKAIDYIEKSLVFYKKANEPINIAIGTLELANMQFKNEALAKANKATEDALKMFTKINNDGYTVDCYILKGQILSKLNKHKEGIVYLRRAIDLNKKSDKTVSLINLYTTLAEIQIKDGDLKSAETNLALVLKKLENSSNLVDLKKAHQLMYEVQKVNGNINEALKHHEILFEISNGIVDKEKNKSIAEMEAKYLIAEKENQAKTLELEKLAFQQLALRAQMNPHFIFNSLNSIQKHIISKDHDLAASYLASFSSLMRKILETSQEPSIYLEDVIEFLHEYLKLEQLRFRHSFTYQLTISDDIEEDIMLVPAMIVQPYVENAIIHGVNELENGRIEIHFELKDDDTILCTVTDNGKGVKAVQQKTKRSHRALGTKITKDRIDALSKQLNRKIEVTTIGLTDKESNVKGTQVTITLPIL